MDASPAHTATDDRSSAARRLVARNAFATPGGMRVLGTEVDLGRVEVDAYIVAGSNDHIVDWRNAYRSTQLLGGDSRFVLSTSDHIQALINPPGRTAGRATASRTPTRPRSPTGRRRRSPVAAAGGPTTSRGSDRARASASRRREPRQPSPRGHGQGSPGTYVMAA
jgi:hypothetical protein